MATTTAMEPALTVADFLSLPEDGSVDRMLIRGRVWEKPLTLRNRWHAETEARIAFLLETWRHSQVRSQGKVFSGEVGCIFPESGTSVGIDVAYFDAETLARQEDASKYLVGAPVLAVEILSPSDRLEEIQAKVDEYLAVGVTLVWVVDPHFRTVMVFRPDGNPELFSGNDKLDGGAHLPGFEAAVSAVFSD